MRDPNIKIKQYRDKTLLRHLDLGPSGARCSPVEERPWNCPFFPSISLLLVSAWYVKPSVYPHVSLGFCLILLALLRVGCLQFCFFQAPLAPVNFCGNDLFGAMLPAHPLLMKRIPGTQGSANFYIFLFLLPLPLNMPRITPSVAVIAKITIVQ